MEGDIDTFDFELAMILHKTIAELSEMPNVEYDQWRAYGVYKTAMAELKAK